MSVLKSAIAEVNTVAKNIQVIPSNKPTLEDVCEVMAKSCNCPIMNGEGNCIYTQSKKCVKAQITTSFAIGNYPEALRLFGKIRGKM